MIDAVFVGGPLDGERRMLDHYMPYYEVPVLVSAGDPFRDPFDLMTNYRVERYRPERLAPGNFVFYVHEKICIVEALEKIFAWYGQKKTRTETPQEFRGRMYDLPGYPAMTTR
jgi:hypothetical protein